MRIVHLSDIHAFARPSNWFLPDKRILGVSNFYLRRRSEHDWSRVSRAVNRIRLLGPDLVLLTGDVSTVSSPAEFDMALEALEPLINDKSFELVYVPGNHDYYVKNRDAVAALERTFTALNRGRWQLSDLPLVYDVQKLRMILVDTVLPTPPWSSHAVLRDADADWFEQQLAKHDFRGNRRLALIQHYPLYDRYGVELNWRRRCRKNDVLQKALLEGKIDLAFCGHIHHPFVRWEEKGGVELCGGSLTISGLFNNIVYDTQANRLAHEWIDVDLDTPSALPSTQAMMEALEETGAARPIE